ncbi:probable tetraacyldisaccharide 4'-kinase, mitochondrial [Cornus florida]|uniref:probable tetraacyldisaccharide 4'-kinase, mitochondrial n=1 Tax=Cornus florida TaxID=4283 RepID=UPI00289CC501|nr:probable tetraacyldisaccharide 4'-kinase, mitochondrial [Cornus florida]XP_059664834.1 probable tetraacyldisaccharide 4'-kinase, mitochondrial [Cornus florida]
MERLRRVVNQIAYTPRSQTRYNLSPLQLSLIPLLSFASSLYKLTLYLRHQLYHLGLFRQQRLPVPVISIGNLTWGGNGKTPMVEFIARWLAVSGISPLILTRGYAGGDEANMLHRHLFGTSVKIGVGANRAATAACFLERYGFMNHCHGTYFERLGFDPKDGDHGGLDKIAATILDDGMQHLSLWRDLEIVMVNGMMPWGNHQLLPLGPLREPLTALSRADVVVVHHADLVSEENLKILELMMRNVKQSLPIFFTAMAPSYFFAVGNNSQKLPLRAVYEKIVLCVSAIGFANAFVQGIEKIGPLHVDQLDFNDHHLFKTEDMEMIRMRLQKLHAKYDSKPIVVVTEKDYDREPEILKHLDPFEVLVLFSELRILPHDGCTEDSFKKLLRQLLVVKLSGIKIT